jgi:hypothetical protein
MDNPNLFPERRLPHIEGMSDQQHALVTLLNAACYVTDQAPKQILFEKFCEQTGVKVLYGHVTAAI